MTVLKKNLNNLKNRKLHDYLDLLKQVLGCIEKTKKCIQFF